MKMISIFNSTIPNQLCKERLIPLLSFIIGMKKWIGAAVVLLSECRQKAILPRRGRIALSANERIAEFLDFAIQAKFAYVIIMFSLVVRSLSKHQSKLKPPPLVIIIGVYSTRRTFPSLKKRAAYPV